MFWTAQGHWKVPADKGICCFMLFFTYCNRTLYFWVTRVIVLYFVGKLLLQERTHEGVVHLCRGVMMMPRKTQAVTHLIIAMSGEPLYELQSQKFLLNTHELQSQKCLPNIHVHLSQSISREHAKLCDGRFFAFRQQNSHHPIPFLISTTKSFLTYNLELYAGCSCYHKYWQIARNRNILLSRKLC